MCCLRYEQEAYESLVKNVPKQGAFVETKDGFGTAVQVNLLRQTIKVKLDSDNDDSLRTYKTNEFITVPGGRPKDGERPVSTFKYVPEVEEDEAEPEVKWEPVYASTAEEAAAETHEQHKSNNRRRRQRKPRPAGEAKQPKPEQLKAEKPEQPKNGKGGKKPQHKPRTVKVEAKVQGEAKAKAHKENSQPQKQDAPKAEGGQKKNNNRNWRHHRGKGKGKGAGQNKAPQA